MFNKTFGKIIVKCIPIIIIGVLLIKFFTAPDITAMLYKASEENNSVQLTSVTDFPWDRAYIMNEPYERIPYFGFETDLERLETDTARRIIFLDKNKVAYDYVYDIWSIGFKSDKKMIYTSDCTFSIIRKNDKIILEKQ